MRVYHSVSLLLPDGTVLHGASGNAFAGRVAGARREQPRDLLAAVSVQGRAPDDHERVPSSVGYGQTFSVATPNAAQITEVRWIHIGSVTHAFDAGQRANTLTFTRTATGVDVTASGHSPRWRRRATTSLFILNRNGVPSVGKIVQVH